MHKLIKKMLVYIYISIRDIILNIQALFNFKKEHKINRNNNKIKVGFVCQYIPAWNKFEDIYKKMLESDDFEVKIICVPNDISENKNYLNNDTYLWYKENGYMAENALDENNIWKKLEDYNFDYVFFSRPYNNFMPKEYNSKRVSRYTKICCILYAMCLSYNDVKNVQNQDFMRNVALFFADCKEGKQKQIKLNHLGHKLGLQITNVVKIPSLYTILKTEKNKSIIWNFSDNKFRVIWAPRWSTDKVMGGSNFFVYKETFMNYAEQNQDISLVIRPHPLAFNNFIKTGEMTVDEVKEYKDWCNKMSNVVLDENKEYLETMADSSVLVSDFSGIVPEYFMLNKPIIYCVPDINFDYLEEINEMLDACYQVRNEEELLKCLGDLKCGNDYLADKRLNYYEKEYKGKIENSVNDILKIMRKDYLRS